MAPTMFKIALLCAALCWCAANAQEVKYAPCKGVMDDAKINHVIITPCPKLPCQLKRGTNATVSINFTMNADATVATQATTVVHGIIAGVPVPYPTAFTDACATAGIKCPLKPDGTNFYTAKLLVKQEYPQVNLYVKWELQDQTKADIFCFEVPATVV